MANVARGKPVGGWRSGPPSGSPGRDVLLDLYNEQKLSYDEIARRHGVTKQTVLRWLRAAGIQGRSRSEARALARPVVYSEEQREAMRRRAAYARLGITPESRKKQAESQRGNTPPNKGKPMSEEQRQKLVAQRADPEYRKRQGDNIRGAKHYNWKGGLKPEHSARLDRAEWRRLRRKVYERDDWTCADCRCRCLNTKDSKNLPRRKVQAHHIVPRRLGGTDTLDNLVTLCMSCHHKRERRYAGALIA